jgi:hypothetical protein
MFDHPTIVELARHIERKLITQIRGPEAQPAFRT